MIKLKIKHKNIDEARSKYSFLNSAATEIKNFIIDQLKQFPETYFKRGVYMFKINDLPSIKNNEKLKDLKDLKLAVNKKDIQDDIDIPTAYYSPDDSKIDIRIIFNKTIENYNDINKKNYRYINVNLFKLIYHEIIHHLHFKEYKKNKSKNKKISAMSTIDIPMEIYPINDFSGANAEEVKEYKYLTTPHEIDAYVRDTIIDSKKKKIPFRKALNIRIQNIFTTNKGKLLYIAILYNMLKYAMERYPNIKSEQNQETLKKFSQILKTHAK